MVQYRTVTVLDIPFVCGPIPPELRVRFSVVPYASINDAKKGPRASCSMSSGAKIQAYGDTSLRASDPGDQAADAGFVGNLELPESLLRLGKGNRKASLIAVVRSLTFRSSYGSRQILIGCSESLLETKLGFGQARASQ